jgi:hypothetical protein
MNEMLTAFYDAKDFIHHELVGDRETVKYKLYKYFIKESIAPVHRVSHEVEKTGSNYLLHYNAPSLSVS